jgi:HSP20 family protein
MSLFDELFGLKSQKVIIPVDILEGDNSYVLELEVPGIKNDQIEVSIEFDHIVITIDNARDDEEVKYLHRERAVGQYKRRLNFGKPIDSKKASSVLSNGILTIELPYAPEAKKVTLQIN